jgi:hypothetical protein
MRAVLRGCAGQIRVNLGVGNADKAALGLTIPDPTRTPVAAPLSAPILAAIAATPGVHTLRFADANTPDRRGKPPGALGLQLFVAVAPTVPAAAAAAAAAVPPAEPVAGPDAAQFKAFVTRQPFGVEHKSADKGNTAYYFARWQTRTGLVGPWSAATAMVIV